MRYLLRRRRSQHRLSLVLRTHREDESSRTRHGLNACEVICDQVRHRASDQGDQNGVETSDGGLHLPEKPALAPSWCLLGCSDRKDPDWANACCSRRNFSWFSSRVAVTALLCESSIFSRPSWLRRGAHFSCNCSDWNICFTG